MHGRGEGETAGSVRGGKMDSVLCCERLCKAVSILYTKQKPYSTREGMGEGRPGNGLCLCMIA